MNAPRSVDPTVLNIAREVCGEGVRNGSRAGFLTGSHARGEASPESDVDIVLIGDDGGTEMQVRDGYLLAISHCSAESLRKSFDTPAAAGAAVPGVRRSIILEDPHGIAANLKAEAESWSWDRIDADCDTYVAEEITGFTEDVQRLAGQTKLGNTMTVGVMRNVLAMRMPAIIAVHLRLLYETENRLWPLVAERLDEPWRTVQRAALATGGESLEDSCRAAMELYSLAAVEAYGLLNTQQRTVVEHACRTIGYPLSSCGR